MAEVFISYSNPDRAKAQLLAKRLGEAGVSVWWDGELNAHEPFEKTVRKHAEQAKALVVLWSVHSINSAWVLTEADIARRLGRLVPARLSDVALPLGFTRYQTADLSDWNGQDSHPGWQLLLRALRRQTGELGKSEVRLEDPGLKRKAESDRDYVRPKNAKKVRVFIAHATQDKPRLRGPIEVLIDIGFDLWIDKPQRVGLSRKMEARIRKGRIKYGEDWKEGIRKAISQADVVLAFWSAQALARKREQFHYELYQGLIQKKLKQCRLDETSYEQIGTPYSFEQLADLSDFKPNHYHPELDILIEDMTPKTRRRDAALHAPGTVLFEDKFDSDFLWGLKAPSLIGQGKLTVGLHDYDSSRFLYLGKKFKGDASISAAITFCDVKNVSFAGLAFWGIDDDNYYMASLSPYIREGGAFFYQVEHGGKGLEKEWKKVQGFKYGAGKTNQIEVRTRGKTATLLVNGIEAAQLSSGKPPKDGFRVGVVFQGSETTIEFQDFKVVAR